MRARYGSGAMAPKTRMTNVQTPMTTKQGFALVIEIWSLYISLNLWLVDNKQASIVRSEHHALKEFDGPGRDGLFNIHCGKGLSICHSSTFENTFAIREQHAVGNDQRGTCQRAVRHS